ncbi:MAG: pseudouridine synthase [Glaciecola sp.]|nr:pseudouridine synthase [Glaciecola sp.]
MQPQPDPFIVPPCFEDIRVEYEDPDFIVINKPSKLLSLSGKHPLNKDSVHYRVVQQYPTATLIHRLDFGTSGLMLLALNKETNKLLCEQFAQRTVEKRYEAILDGRLAEMTGEIRFPLIKDVDGFPLQKICYETGKPATSRYEVLSYNADNNTSHVQFEPITGRTHQLRLHSMAIGHPIIGCDLYDLNESFAKADRLMLHATSLTFAHPKSNETMHFSSPSLF